MRWLKEKPSSLDLGSPLLSGGRRGKRPDTAPICPQSTVSEQTARSRQRPAGARENRQAAPVSLPVIPPQQRHVLHGASFSAYTHGLDRLKAAGAPMPKPSATPCNSLKGIAIFAGLSPEAIEQIERRCTWKHYAPGEPILDYLDASDDVFFLTLGEVRVTIYSSSGKAVSFREMPAGEIFGEFPALDGGSRSASVEAHTNCLVASMSGASFRELLS